MAIYNKDLTVGNAEAFTPEELFDFIWDNAKDDIHIVHDDHIVDVEDFLDYGMRAYQHSWKTLKDIENICECEVHSEVLTGGNEGIYVDVWLERWEDSSRKHLVKAYGLFSFKTLYEDVSAFGAMGTVAAVVKFYTERFLLENL